MTICLCHGGIDIQLLPRIRRLDKVHMLYVPLFLARVSDFEELHMLNRDHLNCWNT